MPAAIGVAMLTSAVFLGASSAVYRWVVPLQGVAGWPGVWSGGALLAAAGAATGHLVGPRDVRRSRVSDRPGYLVGGIVTVLGALLAQTTVQLGAEGSTSRYDVVGYGRRRAVCGGDHRARGDDPAGSGPLRAPGGGLRTAEP